MTIQRKSRTTTRTTTQTKVRLAVEFKKALAEEFGSVSAGLNTLVEQHYQSDLAWRQKVLEQLEEMVKLQRMFGQTLARQSRRTAAVSESLVEFATEILFHVVSPNPEEDTHSKQAELQIREERSRPFAEIVKKRVGARLNGKKVRGKMPEHFFNAIEQIANEE